MFVFFFENFFHVTSFIFNLSKEIFGTQIDLKKKIFDIIYHEKKCFFFCYLLSVFLIA